MPALRGVEALDVVADRRRRSGPYRVALVVDKLAFQRGEEALCNGIDAPVFRHRCGIDSRSPAASAGAGGGPRGFRSGVGGAGYRGAGQLFDLGGDSLIATKVASWARAELAVAVTAADILRSRKGRNARCGDRGTPGRCPGRRECRVQYAEPDYAFMDRMLEELESRLQPRPQPITSYRVDFRDPITDLVEEILLQLKILL